MAATDTSPSPSKGTQPRTGDPTIAALLTWLVPGAGHVYLGRVPFAIAAFVVVEGLYVLGIVLSKGMLFEYLPPEMRSRFAPALAPEAGNLGGILYHVRTYGYGYGFPRPWPAQMDLGTTLTAASGLLNMLLMSRAHFDARVVERQPGKPIGPALAAGANLILPGLGQILQGRRVRGLVIMVCLLSLFALACLISDGANLDRERHFYYWAGQFLLGLPAMLAEFVNGHPLMTEMPELVDGGIVLGSVAGMLNILTMLDAYGYSEALHLGEDPPGSKDEATTQKGVHA
ncbi:MAG: DUF6677 family protein [Planctomycetota bacterium]